MKFECKTEGSDWELCEGDTAKAVAKAYANQGFWGQSEIGATTTWVDVAVRAVDGTLEDEFRVAIHPDEPACSNGHDHEWESPHAIVGGMKENPGVFGNGGGVLIREVCSHCGAYRVTDTWATDPETGRQGLKSIQYEPADSESRDWAGRA